MFEVHPITALDTPELQPYATLKRSSEHEQQGIFVAESEKVVRRLLHSRFGIVSLLADDRWLAEFRPLLEARGLGVSGLGEDGLVRVLELREHPFFFGTLYVPQARSRPGAPHPLVAALAEAAREHARMAMSRGGSR